MQNSKEYKNCQSCGMPLKKAPGSEEDGTSSKKYCSNCYQEGAFVHSEWSAADMQQFVKDKMKSMGFPGFLAALFVKKIPKLERWK